MSGTPQARTPAKGASGPHPVRRRPAVHAMKSPTSKHRSAVPSTPPSSSKEGKRGTISGGGAAHRRPTKSASVGAHNTSSPRPSQQMDAEGAATPPRPSTVADGPLLCDPTAAAAAAAAAVSAERQESTPASPAAPSLADTAAATLPCGMHLLSSPPAVGRAVSLSAASLLSSTRALEGDAPEEGDAADTVRGDSDDDERDRVPAQGAAMLGCATTQISEVLAPLPVTPERPLQVRFFRCAKPLVVAPKHDNHEAQQHQVSNEETVELEAKPRVTLGGRGDAVQAQSPLSGTLPLVSGINDGYEVAKHEEEDGEPTALEPRVLDMNTTLLGEDDDTDGEEKGEAVSTHEESSEVPRVPLRESALDRTTADEPTADPEEAQVAVDTVKAVGGTEAVAAPIPSRTPVLSSTELHAVQPTKKSEQPVLTQRNVRACMLCDSDDDLEAELMCEMSVAATSTNSSFADSRGSISSSSSSCMGDLSEETVLQRRDTAAPGSMPRRAAGPSAEELHGNGCRLERREVPSPSPSHADAFLDDAAGAAAEAGSGAEAGAAEKRVSLSSARGQSGSCGCTEGMTSPASHHTRRSTPRIDEGEEEEESTEGPRRSVSPIVVAPLRMEDGDNADDDVAAARSTADLADVWMEGSAAAPAAGPVMVIPLTEVRVRLNRKPQQLRATQQEEDEEEEVCAASRAAVHHARVTASAHDARHRIWKAALVSFESLITEYEESLLTCIMRSNASAWLPDAPLTGLHHVNKAAVYTVAPAKRKTAKALTPPAAPTDPFLAALPKGGEQLSEMELLFELFVAAPSEAARKHLCSTFFGQQLHRHHNWVRHLQFEFLYVRIVAARAMSMLEMHERRLTCMRRDLGIRDTIELFMLLAPRPRAPTLTSGRGVFSAFRMALHALGGGGGDGQRSSRASSKARSSSESRKPRAPQPLRVQRTALPAAAAAAAPSGAPPRCFTVKRETQAAPALGPLYASERCRSGKYAVPVVCEHTVSPGGPCSRGVSPSSNTDAPPKSSATTGVAGERDGTRASQPAVREVVPTADPPRDATSHHRGVPRPLNKTYSDYYKKVAEKRSESGSALGDVHLPRLLRTNSRTSSTSRRNSASEHAADSRSSSRENTGASASRAAAPPQKRPQTSRRVSRGKEDDLGAALMRLGRRFSSSSRRSRSPKRRRDIELSDGHLRAKERVAAKPRERTPPPPPTEADFVDLRDDVALRRFL